MKASIIGSLAIGVAFCARLAAAQTPPPSQTPPAAVGIKGTDSSKLFLTIAGGAAAVQKVGGGASAEIGLFLTDRFEVFGEGAWMQNVATRRRIDLAKVVATSIQAAQGKPSEGTVEATGFYGGGGIRVLLTKPGHVRPYLTFGAGGARVVLKPNFMLSGSDITSNLPQYGVTLGSDLTGETSAPAFSGGFGVRVSQGRWFADVSVRATSIQTEGQATTVKRANGGIGIRF